MLSAAKHLLAHGERPFPFVPQGFGSRAQGDNRVRVVCWRVVSGRGKFESEWSPVARVARVVGVAGVAGIAGELAKFAARVARVVGVAGIAVLFSGNGVPVNG